jgi:hypothetical protein
MVNMIGGHKPCPGRGSNPQRQNSLEGNARFGRCDCPTCIYCSSLSCGIMLLLFRDSDYRRGLDLVIGFTELLQNVTSTSNYSAIANSHTPQLTIAHTKSS